MSKPYEIQWDRSLVVQQEKLFKEGSRKQPVTPWLTLSNYDGGCGLKGCGCSGDPDECWVAGYLPLPNGELTWFQMMIPKKDFQKMIDESTTKYEEDEEEDEEE